MWSIRRVLTHRRLLIRVDLTFCLFYSYITNDYSININEVSNAKKWDKEHNRNTMMFRVYASIVMLIADDAAAMTTTNKQNSIRLYITIWIDIIIESRGRYFNWFSYHFRILRTVSSVTPKTYPYPTLTLPLLRSKGKVLKYFFKSKSKVRVSFFDFWKSKGKVRISLKWLTPSLLLN